MGLAILNWPQVWILALWPVQAVSCFLAYGSTYASEVDKQNKNKQNLTNNMGGIKYIQGRKSDKKSCIILFKVKLLTFFRFLFIYLFLIWNFQYEDGGARKSIRHESLNTLLTIFIHAKTMLGPKCYYCPIYFFEFWIAIFYS